MRSNETNVTILNNSDSIFEIKGTVKNKNIEKNKIKKEINKK